MAIQNTVCTSAELRELALIHDAKLRGTEGYWSNPHYVFEFGTINDSPDHGSVLVGDPSEWMVSYVATLIQSELHDYND